jgi:hypothetical protein
MYLVDRNGKPVVDERFSYLYSVGGGVFGYRASGKVGLVGSDGKEITSPQFAWARGLGGGLVEVERKDEVGHDEWQIVRASDGKPLPLR